MVEALYFAIGLMIMMAALPVFVILSLTLAISKRFLMRWHDPVERYRFRVRLGGNVAYFVGLMNAIAVLYYFIAAGLPLNDRFWPWFTQAATRLPEGWYIWTAVLFAIGGLALKLARETWLAAPLLLLFLAQIGIEMAPALFDLIRDPGLFARFIAEIRRMHDAYAQVGGMPGTVMGTILAGLVYGAAIQLAYYVLVILSFVIAIQGARRLKYRW